MGQINDFNAGVQPLNPQTPKSLITQVSSYRFSNYDRELIEASAHLFPCPDNATFKSLLPHILIMESKLPLTYKRFLLELTMDPYANAFGIVSNCPGVKGTFAAEIFQLASAVAMGGRPIAQKNEADEQILQRIKPKKSLAKSQTSSSYANMLNAHGDDFASGLYRVAWTCPRLLNKPKKSPPTFMYDMRKICDWLRLNGFDGILDILAKNKVSGRYPESQRKTGETMELGEFVPILSGPEGSEYFHLEWLGDTVVFNPKNPNAPEIVQYAIDFVLKAMENVGVGYTLQLDDMALLCNQRGFHARGPFPDGYNPKKDGLRELIRFHISMDPWFSRQLDGHLL